MLAQEIRQKYLDFFKTKGHKQIPTAPLIPENDPTVLFTTAGMHPLVPYLMGEAHPQGARLVNCQKCIRTADIDEVGDDTHLTFFEMLGNWSLGDYFKKEAIEWSFEFLTSPQWLGLDTERLAISVFAGDADAPRDEESVKVWRSLGIPKERIAYLSKSDNWWGPAGQTGPCGPDTEMFYWLGGQEPPTQFDPNNNRWVEIWNNVFMEYEKKRQAQKKTFEYIPLKQKNVDTGMGLERITAISQGKNNIYETELFSPLIEKIKAAIPQNIPADERAVRLIADHIKAASFILGDQYGVTPTNVGQGYILRRLIRRAMRFANILNIKDQILTDLARIVIENFKQVYPELAQNQNIIYEQLTMEENKFQKTLAKGLREFEKIYYFDLHKIVLEKFSELYPQGNPLINIKIGTADPEVLKNFSYYLSTALNLKNKINPRTREQMEEEKRRRELFIKSVLDNSAVIKQEFNLKFSTLAFKLYDTYGFPYEITQELAKEKNISLDQKIFEQALKKHQEKSRQGAEHKFAGGLADHQAETKKLHTATHLLHQALRNILGHHVKQKGSNITQERLRFDFSHPQPLTSGQIKQTENLVNSKIKEALPIKTEEMDLEQARQSGAIGLFPAKYQAKVKVYAIGNFSTEICGGPHVENTSQLGTFKIIKEESAGAGIRRLKAILKS